MLDEKEIDAEIARLEYIESSYSNYSKLADLYTIRNQMKNVEGNQMTVAVARNVLGDSQFLQKVSEKDPEAVWLIMNELMDTLKVVNSKVYNSIMRKIDEI